jgi:hypothetical protein
MGPPEPEIRLIQVEINGLRRSNNDLIRHVQDLKKMAVTLKNRNDQIEAENDRLSAIVKAAGLEEKQGQAIEIKRGDRRF